MVRLLENNVSIKTIPCILKLLLLIIIETSITNVIFIKTQNMTGKDNCIKIYSKFNI